MMQVFKCAEKDMNDKTECPRTKNMFAPSEAEQARVSCVSSSCRSGARRVVTEGDVFAARLSVMQCSAMQWNGL